MTLTSYLYTGNKTFSHSQCERGIMQCVCVCKGKVMFLNKVGVRPLVIAMARDFI